MLSLSTCGLCLDLKSNRYCCIILIIIESCSFLSIQYSEYWSDHMTETNFSSHTDGFCLGPLEVFRKLLRKVVHLIGKIRFTSPLSQFEKCDKHERLLSKTSQSLGDKQIYYGTSFHRQETQHQVKIDIVHLCHACTTIKRVIVFKCSGAICYF